MQTYSPVLAMASELIAPLYPSNIVDILMWFGAVVAFLVFFAVAFVIIFLIGCGEVKPGQVFKKGAPGKAARADFLGLSIVAILGTVVALLFGSPMYIFPKVVPQTVIVDAENRVVQVINEVDHVPFWRLNRLKGTGGNIYSFAPRRIAVEMTKTVSPHKTIVYRVEVDVLGSLENFQKYADYLLSRGKSASDETSYHLYEMNEQLEEMFSRFYNPLDGAQQSEFSKMVVEFLTPRLLESGMTPKRASFRMG